MSERPQFEYHPDADQIGAFVEQALPEHEHVQMLDHLAVCGECRAIVALSLPEIEAPAIPQLTPARRRWWAGWALAWPVAGAVAAVAFLIFYMHSAKPDLSAPPQSQVAVSRPPVATESPEKALRPPANPTLRDSQLQGKDKGIAASTSGAGTGAMPKAPAAKSAFTADGAIVAGRDRAELSRLEAASPPQQLGNYRQSDGPSAASQNQVSQNTNNAIADEASGASGNPEGGLQLKAPNSTSGTINRPEQIAQAPAPQPSSATTVSVAAANTAPMETISADLANVQIAPEAVATARLQHPLPSHNAVLSMAVQGRYVVAIDTRNAVFLSNDAGKHWKAIPAPWPGHAVKAVLVGRPTDSASSASFARGRAFQSNEKAPAALGSMVAQAPAPGASGSSIVGTVIDPSGASIPGANVVVTEIATGTAHTVQTDSTGRYLVDGLAPGNYQVEAQASGFNSQSVAAVAVGPNRSTAADLTLKVSASSQSVTVTGADTLQVTDKKEKAAKPAASNRAGPIFEINTDSGERWTSSDGVTWTRM